MPPIATVSEVFDAMQRVKAGAPAYCTNFFPVQKKLQGWIDNGELLGEFRDRAAFFFRKDRDFRHFYFCAADPAALQAELAALPVLREELMATDLVGNEAALAGMLAALESAGFRRYRQLQRMARAAVQPAAGGGESKIVLAEKTDAGAILELLDGAFDRYADQLPVPYEIEAAIEARQILVARSAGTVAALLFFETQGFTSTVRYWAVAEGFRDQKFGSALMRRYFEMHTAVRRFVLWVVSDNQNAIQKYQHYGYAADGLIDHVLANEMIQA